MPLPMTVPPGHMVQQILDQHGTLQHVILSLDPAAAAAQSGFGDGQTAQQATPATSYVSGLIQISNGAVNRRTQVRSLAPPAKNRLGRWHHR